MASLCARGPGRPGLADAYRRCHPHARCYTYHAFNAASRIDRIYVPTDMMEHVEQCTAAALTVSDHRPVVLHLRPLTPTSTGRGLPRVRMLFWDTPALRQPFEAELGQLVAAAPADDPALLAWWPGFKAALAAVALRMDREYRRLTAGVDPAQRAAGDAFGQALQQVETAGGSLQALHAVLAARRRYTASVAAAAGPAEQQRRHDWLKCGERPCPLITQLTRPPAASRQISALRVASGGLTTDGPQMAAQMAEHYASVSAAPGRDAAAEAAVLAAVAAHASKLDAGRAAVAGRPVVGVEEVRHAIKYSKPGTSPGPDGLPTVFWKRGGPLLQDLLARLFSAVGGGGTTPAGFLDGVVTPIFKGGDAALAANYRPITLLNTDYRLMAKVLATCLGPVLDSAIGPEQTAFMPGRRIGDNSTFLHLLPAILRSNTRLPGAGLPVRALVAFLDFRKAYDTISRPFLLAVMRATGAGDGLVGWASAILTATSAAVNVNGHVSPQASYQAGVRQGCPLAPLLYLFVAWALQCWLRTCPAVGVEVVPGVVVHAPQFADDTQALLRDLGPEAVGVFVAHMSVFERASGQGLNLTKSRLVPMGDTAAWEPLPSEVGGVQVVRHAVSLGASFSNDPDPSGRMEWKGRVEGVGSCFGRIAKLGLSVFGRAFASAGYGVSKVLYHIEHNTPPAALLEELQRRTTAVVDRGEQMGPEGRMALSPGIRHRLPGIPSALLVGKPSAGGFGMLPWREHCLARQAHLAWRYLVWATAGPAGPRGQPVRGAGQPSEGASAPAPAPAPRVQPLWVPLVSCFLARVSPAVHPG
jgi:hypothetical protein